MQTPNPTGDVAQNVRRKTEPSQGEAAGIRSAGPADTAISGKRPGHCISAVPMHIEATIDVDGGDGSQVAELTLTNWDEQVKIVAPKLFESPVYVDRDELMRILAALEVSAD